MAQIYRVTLIFRLRNKGWTETYYRAAESARLATAFDSAGDLAPFLMFRPPAVILQAIRAQEVNGLRRMFLRVVNAAGIYGGTPDVTAVSVRLEAIFTGGADRSLWMRGIGDDLMLRDRLGHDVMTASLAQILTTLFSKFQQLGFLGQVLEPESLNPWQPVSDLFPDPADSRFSRVRIFPGDFKPVWGDMVYFGGPRQKTVANEVPYWVMDGLADDGTFPILYQYPPSLRVVPPRQPIQVRYRRMRYEPITEWSWCEYSTHHTGPLYYFVSWAALNPFQAQLAPCGRLMDMVRRPSRVFMRMNRTDPNQLVSVVWYKPEPASGILPPALPFDHCFGSQAWFLRWEPEPLIGEAFEPRTNYNGGDPVRLEGQGYCGTEFQWANGCVATDPVRPVNPTTGQPCCCGKGIMVIEIGGAAGFANEYRAALVPEIGGAAGFANEYRAALVPEIGGAGEIIESEGRPVTHHCGFACPLGDYDDYNLDVTGATGDGAAWNGHWSLPHSASCTWLLTHSMAEFAQLIFTSIGGYNMNVNLVTATGVGYYFFNGRPGGDCLEEYTLDYYAPLSSGAGWPLTITIS